MLRSRHTICAHVSLNCTKYTNVQGPFCYATHPALPQPLPQKVSELQCALFNRVSSGGGKGGLVALVDGTNEYFGEWRGGIAAAGKEIKLTHL